MNQLAPPANMMAGAQPVQPPTKFHDVTVVKKKTVAKARVQGVPPEEFGIERQARTLRDCGYCFHRVIRRQSDLIAEGFDEDDIKSLPTYVVQTGVEELSRDTVNENTGTGGDKGLNVANRFVRIIEHYVRMDYEQNNKPKLYRVTTGGEIGSILKRNGKLEIVEADDIPFASMTPIPVTHRFFGKSVADLVLDIQRIKTALTRGLLDNTYMAVNSRPIVSENDSNESTLDDLLVSKPGAPIRGKTPNAVTFPDMPPIADKILPVMEYMDSQREWRTGVSRQAQGPNADALSNTPATTAQLLYTSAQTKMKLIARIFAETGIRDLFSLLHETIRKHASQAQVVRLRNQWITVDPRDWKRRDDMTIHVGLGPGSKETQMAAQQLIIQAQQQGIGAGLVSKKNLFNSATQLTKLAGHKSPDQFFVDPSKPSDPNDPASAPIPPPPSPDMMKAQTNQQEMQLKAQLDQQKAQNDTQHQIAKNSAELELKRQEAQLNAELAITKAKLDADLKEREFAHSQRMADMEFSHKQRMSQFDVEVTHRKNVMDANVRRNAAVDGDGVQPHPQLMQALQQLAQQHADSHKQITALLTAPKTTKVHRDPKTGRVTHATSAIDHQTVQ